MKIHHLRNATLIIEVDDKVILADPMLGKKGEAGPPFTLFRFKPRCNPLVDLPPNTSILLNKVTHCIITHLHPDHLDRAGLKYLRSMQTPVICSIKDEVILKKKGLNIMQTVKYHTEAELWGGKIQGIPAVHGYGFVTKLMGNVMGYFITFPNGKSIYLSADTIYTDAVHKVLHDLKPDLAVVAGGTAQLDLFQPLLMKTDDLLKFVSNAPGHVLINHLEAVNHCPATRQKLYKILEDAHLVHKVFIPDDGASRSY